MPGKRRGGDAGGAGAEPRVTGAYPVGDRRGGDDKGSGLKKLLFLLLGLLLLALLVFAVISLLGGDDDKSSSDSGQLSADGTELLPPPPEGLASLAGKPATGKDVVVQSVNGNEGFFVGSSAADRVYIEWGGDVGENEASRFQPEKGQKVNLTGPVQAGTPKAKGKLKLSAEDAKLVASQGGFVNADKVTAAE